METTVLIAIGSNRRHPRHGSPADVVREAVRALAEARVPVEAVSRLYHTAPLGPPQPAFVNAAVVARTGLSPERLLALLKRIERRFGPKGKIQWGPRVLDLDIIGYGNKIVPGRMGWQHGHGLAVPHRCAHKRAFVLRPLADVAPDWRHPVLGLTVRQMAARVGDAKSIRATEASGIDVASLAGLVPPVDVVPLPRKEKSAKGPAAAAAA
ncbi:MAG TPA: 2-amino-4-hydroxy-6-hydroxymethyldihydropteridine diphosphokinase [Pedomonas sp.]|uniref:2-amino-4-hydroxy-6- hydroxymethyldihydropteridine diphosphokinase n=1 Tax=Pedomonas sp. TaxID=2976421 RepID=UPI002F4262A5